MALVASCSMNAVQDLMFQRLGSTDKLKEFVSVTVCLHSEENHITPFQFLPVLQQSEYTARLSRFFMCVWPLVSLNIEECSAHCSILLLQIVQLTVWMGLRQATAVRMD